MGLTVFTDYKKSCATFVSLRKGGYLFISNDLIKKVFDMDPDDVSKFVIFYDENDFKVAVMLFRENDERLSDFPNSAIRTIPKSSQDYYGLLINLNPILEQARISVPKASKREVITTPLVYSAITFYLVK